MHESIRDVLDGLRPLRFAGTGRDGSRSKEGRAGLEDSRKKRASVEAGRAGKGRSGCEPVVGSRGGAPTAPGFASGPNAGTRRATRRASPATGEDGRTRNGTPRD